MASLIWLRARNSRVMTVFLFRPSWAAISSPLNPPQHLQQQGLLILGGQAGYVAPKPLVLHLLLAVQRILIALGMLVEIDEIELLALEAPGIFPPQYGDEPGLGGLVIDQGVDRLPGPQEGFLHQILGDLRIPAQPVGVAVDVPVQGMHQGLVFRLFVCHIPIDRGSRGILSRSRLFFSKKT